MNIDALLAERSGIRLDIGCGANKQPGFVGLDMQAGVKPDILWDINCHPWPIPDEFVLMAMCSHLIEHIPTVAIDNGRTWLPFIEFMDEVWRILKVGGEFAIVCPHGSSQGYLQDPTHCHALNEATFAYFDPAEPATGGMLYGFYRPKPWKVKYISWSPAANIETVLIKRSLEDLQSMGVSYE